MNRFTSSLVFYIVTSAAVCGSPVTLSLTLDPKSTAVHVHVSPGTDWWQETLVFDKFSIPGATLTGIQFTLTGSLSVLIEGINTGAVTDLRYHHNYMISAWTDDGRDYLSFATSVVFGDSGDSLVNPGAFTIFIPISSATNSWPQGNNQVNSGKFLNTGQVRITGGSQLPDAFGRLWIDPPSLADSTFQFTSSAQLGVTYFYTVDVPEPATGVMLSIGLLCAIWYKRPRR